VPPSTVACVCDRIVSYPTTRRVLILQHPQERDAILGSAQILVASLPKAKLVVGLSWRNFAHALGDDGSTRAAGRCSSRIANPRGER